VTSSTVIALVLLAVAAVIVASALLTRRLMFRQGFGPEYDRMVREVGPRRAKAEFIQRRSRVTGLGIKPLTAEQRAKYTGEWAAAQERFIDNPPQSAQAAAALVGAVAADRGYQVTDHAQLVSDLSVHHGRWLDGYRRARRITDGADSAATEELRRALLGHRALFRDLLGSTPNEGTGRPSARWLTTGRLAAGRLAAVRRFRPATALGRPWRRPAGGPGRRVSLRLPTRTRSAQPKR
jgi:hypothetical protein